MANFREALKEMREAHFAVHGEPVVINGVALEGKPISNDSDASGFDVPTAIVVKQVLIRTRDAQRIQIEEGMQVRMRGEDLAVLSYIDEDTFLTRVILQAAL